MYHYRNIKVYVDNLSMVLLFRVPRVTFSEVTAWTVTAGTHAHAF